MGDHLIRIVSESLELLQTGGRNAAVAFLSERLDVGECEAREILWIATAPDPRALAGRI
jgi:hypothetical protein